MRDNFVQFANDHADIIINTPKIQERINQSKKNMVNKWTPTNHDQKWMYLTTTMTIGNVQKPEF